MAGMINCGTSLRRSGCFHIVPLTALTLVLVVLVLGVCSYGCGSQATNPQGAPTFGLDPGRVPEPSGIVGSVTKDDRSIEEVCVEKGFPYPPPDLNLVVDKASYTLAVRSGDDVLKVYPISLGPAPKGPKELEGDGRTPEGAYYVCQKASEESLHDKYLGTRWLRLSYPGPHDARKGFKARRISEAEYRAILAAYRQKKIPPQNTALGGGIGIHGGAFDKSGQMARNWTGGCIGMYNEDIEEFYDLVDIGTPVYILPAV